MIGLGVIGDAGILDFDEVADMHVTAEFGAGAQAGEGTDNAAGADHGIFQHTVGLDAHAVTQHHAALEHAIDVDRDVAAADQLAAHVDARRIGQRHAGFHQRLGDIALMHALQRGELHFAVHAFGFPRCIGMGGHHRHAFRHRQGDDVGQVVLALRIAVAQRRQPARQRRGGCHQDAGIDFADRLFGIVGVLLLDDARHQSLASDDAAIALRVVDVRGEQRQRVLARRCDQALQRSHTRQRHVAVEHQA